MLHVPTPSAHANKENELNQQTDLSKKLRAHVSGHAGLATNTDNKLLLDAADEIERYYTGMLNWKHSAEAKAAIAAQEPKQAMTDDQIAKIHDAVPQTGNWVNDFARAIERASSPNKELVEALREIIANDPFNVHNSGIIARAALRAAGVEVTS